jgi:transposase
LLNTLIYRSENGGKWWSLPQSFGNWQVISVRLNRWAEKGVLEGVFKALTGEKLVLSGYALLIQGWSKRILTLMGPEKNGLQRIEKSRGGSNTKLYAVTVGVGG